MAQAQRRLVCIVLGAQGFAGSAIMNEGSARGHVMLSVGSEQYDDHVGMSCDLLINANGNSRKYFSRQYPLKDFDLSVTSVTRSLFDFNFASYVYLSSVDVYPSVNDPAQNNEEVHIDARRLSHYGFHKYMAENIVRHYAPSWLILRLGGLIGPGLRKNAIYDLLHRLPLRVHPDAAYQYLDTRIMAKSIFDLCEQGREEMTINLAGQGSVSVRDVATLIPGCPLQISGDNSPLEHYEVNVEQACSLFPGWPATRDMVAAFIREVLAGECVLK